MGLWLDRDAPCLHHAFFMRVRIPSTPPFFIIYGEIAQLVERLITPLGDGCIQKVVGFDSHFFHHCSLKRLIDQFLANKNAGNRDTRLEIV